MWRKKGVPVATAEIAEQIMTTALNEDYEALKKLLESNGELIDSLDRVSYCFYYSTLWSLHIYLSLLMCVLRMRFLRF